MEVGVCFLCGWPAHKKDFKFGGYRYQCEGDCPPYGLDKPARNYIERFCNTKEQIEKIKKYITIHRAEIQPNPKQFLEIKIQIIEDAIKET